MKVDKKKIQFVQAKDGDTRLGRLREGGEMFGTRACPCT